MGGKTVLPVLERGREGGLTNACDSKGGIFRARPESTVLADAKPPPKRIKHTTTEEGKGGKKKARRREAAWKSGRYLRGSASCGQEEKTSYARKERREYDTLRRLLWGERWGSNLSDLMGVKEKTFHGGGGDAQLSRGGKGEEKSPRAGVF